MYIGKSRNTPTFATPVEYQNVAFLRNRNIAPLYTESAGFNWGLLGGLFALPVFRNRYADGPPLTSTEAQSVGDEETHR